MRKTRKNPTTPSPVPEDPLISWQTGEFERQVQFRFTIPYQLLLLCKLMDITPRQLLTDFMDNLSLGSWKREGRENVRQLLVHYFLEHGYGRHLYPPGDILTIFRELDAIGMLFPTNADPSLQELHSKWREKYQAYWFNKWFGKFNRNLHP